MKWVNVKAPGLHLLFNNKMFKTPAIVPIFEGQFDKFISMLKKMSITNYTVSDKNDFSPHVSTSKKNIIKHPIQTPEDNIQNIDFEKADNLDDLLNIME